MFQDMNEGFCAYDVATKSAFLHTLPISTGCLPENCPFTTTNLPSVNVPVFAGIFIKVSDLMQIADDMGCMNPSATCGCTFCLLESQHWGAVDSKLNFKPKIKTGLLKPIQYPVSHSCSGSH